MSKNTTIPDTNHYQMLLTNFISKSTSFSKTTCERALERIINKFELFVCFESFFGDNVYL